MFKRLINQYYSYNYVLYRSKSLNMPKKHKNVKTDSSTANKPTPSPEQNVFQQKPNGISVQILAKAGAKRTEIVEISSDGVCVAVQAPPVDGKANEEIVSFVAEVTGVRKNAISIERGQKSRNKTLLICGDKICLEEFKAKLMAEIKQK